MTLEQLNKKKWRYITAIEALTELVEHGDEDQEKLQSMIDYFSQKRSDAHADFLVSKNIHEMQVIDVDCVTGNQ